MRTAAIIVTYNRKKLLCDNLEMILLQSKSLDKIFVIDNHSEDGTRKYLLEQPFFDQELIRLVTMPENLGGAGGFCYGLKLAYQEKYDFFWLMDDDGRPYNKDTFLNLWDAAFKIYRKGKKEIFFNSLVTFDGEYLSFNLLGEGIKVSDIKQRYNKNLVIVGKANPFNGTLLSKETVALIGFPNKNYFIKFDEIDYFYRCLYSEVYIATVINSIYYHPKSKISGKKFIKWHVPVYHDSLAQQYYGIRNRVYFLKTTFVKDIYKYLVLRFIAVLLYEDNRPKRISVFIRGVYDGIWGNLGKKI